MKYIEYLPLIVIKKVFSKKSLSLDVGEADNLAENVGQIFIKTQSRREIIMGEKIYLPTCYKIWIFGCLVVLETILQKLYPLKIFLRNVFSSVISQRKIWRMADAK